MWLLQKKNGKLLHIFGKVINCGHTGRLGQFVEQVVRLRLDKNIIPSVLRQLEREPLPFSVAVARADVGDRFLPSLSSLYSLNSYSTIPKFQNLKILTSSWSSWWYWPGGTLWRSKGTATNKSLGCCHPWRLFWPRGDYHQSHHLLRHHHGQYHHQHCQL